MPLISFTDKELMTIETSAARARQPGRFLRDVANALKGHYVIRPRNSRAVAVAIQRQYLSGALLRFKRPWSRSPITPVDAVFSFLKPGLRAR